MNSCLPAPRIYLAGPDVFYPDSALRFCALKVTCQRWGLEGLEPSDGDIPADFTGSDDDRAQRIYAGNIARIQQADAVIANLCDFRGLEPDSGTVFEMGYAIALQKPLVAYGVPPGSYAERVAAQLPSVRDAHGVLRETSSGRMIEGLGQRLNLMLTRSAHLTPSAEAAIAKVAQLLRLPTAL